MILHGCNTPQDQQVLAFESRNAAPTGNEMGMITRTTGTGGMKRRARTGSIRRSRGQAMQDKECLSLAVCAVVREQLRISPTGGRPGLPQFDVVSVSDVGDVICVAFRQEQVDPARTFVWTIAWPPGDQNLWSAEAIITENFLDMAFEGTRN